MNFAKLYHLSKNNNALSKKLPYRRIEINKNYSFINLLKTLIKSIKVVNIPIKKYV